MKTKRFIALFLSIILCFTALLCAAPGALAAEGDVLTVKRVVQISDTQLLVFFSEPIAVNLVDQNRGPWIALRVVDEGDNLIYTSDDGTGSALQWQGGSEFVGDKHDVVLFTYGNELENITTLRNFSGELGAYAAGHLLKFCIEEVPYNLVDPASDGLIDNITTADGTVRLSANRPVGWDGNYSYIETDFNYEIDLSNLSDVEIHDNFDYGTVMSVVAKEKAPENTVVKNDPVFTVCLLAGSLVLAAVICLVLTMAIRKAGKKK